jgi:hypothetical protein
MRFGRTAAGTGLALVFVTGCGASSQDATGPDGGGGETSSVGQEAGSMDSGASLDASSDVAPSDAAKTSDAAASGDGGWQLPPGHFVPAKLALKIIAPFAGLDTRNRYYKAYPGIPYRVPIVVLGGAWPFKYELTSAPSGMTVGSTLGSADYGVIDWQAPTASASSTSVTLRVTDQSGTSATVTWSISVTTSGFLFVDAANGSDSNAGTIAAPLRTIAGWYGGATYGAKSDASHANDFVYYRTGTYSTSTAFLEAAGTGQRMPCVSGNKPKVHLAYPGEKAVLDTTSGSFIFYSDDAVGYWFSGFTATGMGAGGDFKWVEWDSGPSDIVFFDNQFDVPVDTGVTGSNPALLMSRSNAPAISTRVAFVNNTTQGTNGHDVFLGYDTADCVFERNTINGSTDPGNGFYAKIDNADWTVRNNTGLSANSTPLVAIDGYSTSNAIEICWNDYASAGNGILLGLTPNHAVGSVWAYRNTWQIANQAATNLTVTDLEVSDDVVQYTNASANSHGWIDSSANVTATFTGEECVGSGKKYVDSSGNLVAPYAAACRGTRGHEVQ